MPFERDIQRPLKPHCGRREKDTFRRALKEACQIVQPGTMYLGTQPSSAAGWHKAVEMLRLPLFALHFTVAIRPEL
jgi:hypothetical protein